MREIGVSVLAEVINSKIVGNDSLVIDGLNLCNRNSNAKSILSYAVNANYVENVISKSNIRALIVSESDADAYLKVVEKGGALILSNHAEADFYSLHEWLISNTDFYPKYDFPKKIGDNCSIHNSAIIDDGVIIGDNVRIGANTVIMCGTVIENNVSIGNNCSIGADGFQIIRTNEGLKNIHHTGKCRICSNAYVDNNCCIARSLFDGETYIGPGTHIGCLVEIGHNCYLEEDVTVTPGVTFCGSSSAMKRAYFGAGSSIKNRVVVGEEAVVGMGAVVTKNVDPRTVVVGSPAKPLKRD